MTKTPKTELYTREDQGIAVVSAERRELQLKVDHYLSAAKSPSTQRAYRSAIRQFLRWGGQLPTDPDTLIRYLVAHAETRSPRTLSLYMTAIGYWHEFQGFPNPANEPSVREILIGIRRDRRVPRQKALALRPEQVKCLLEAVLSDSRPRIRARDRALLLVGYFGAFRRSELAQIQVEHLDFTAEGMVVLIPHSKTDQEGVGLEKAIPSGSGISCPVRAVREWMEVGGIQSGPLFRSINRWDQIQDRGLPPAAINERLKVLARRAGLDASTISRISAHSLRRGFATTAAQAGADFDAIKRQGGWRSDATVRGYIEEGEMFEKNAGNAVLNKLSEIMGE